ncbi:MAG: ribose-phosphate diphosphokinase [Candidatus Diapherotrites archaeon]|nr:ribose-phosphate diphosphokinase [Candidatus Diapherotrites archaeon]
MNSILIEINHHIGKEVARLAGIEYQKAILEPFPDNESYLRFPFSVKRKKIFLLADLAKKPNEILSVLLLAAKTLRKLKARKIYLIAPYMVYLRQDHVFHNGEAVSGFIIADFVSSLFDGIITIDPHLHRVESMRGFFRCKTQKLTATKKLSDYFSKMDAVLVGPDAESKQWIKAIAENIGKQFVVANKTRQSSRQVKVEIKRGSVVLEGKTAIIIDDIISTGHTIIEAAKALKKEKVKKIECYCVHGLFMEGALEKLRRNKIKVGATNTLKNPVEVIDIAPELAEGVREWL